MTNVYHGNTQLWWPDWEDRPQLHSDYHTRHLADLDAAIAQCTSHRTAIQAGGNVGIWPRHMGVFFNRVYTAEADPDLCACLRMNLDPGRFGGQYHVIPAAFGARCARMPFYRTGKSGTGTLCPENPAKEQADPILQPVEIDMITIDSLAARDVDLIYLDIEGYESDALNGARATIEKWKPLVVCETFDRTREAIDRQMQDFGYHRLYRRGRDIAYGP